MCTYNGAAHVREQLDTIGNQTRPPDELIICDDRSNDQTPDIIRDFAATAKFPVRLHINEMTLRSSPNFQKTISLCTGDIIALADQDDLWKPNKLERFEEAFNRDPEL